MQRATLGAAHPALATSLNSLAVLAYEQGRHGRAAIARLGEEALAVARATYGAQRHRGDHVGQSGRLPNAWWAAWTQPDRTRARPSPRPRRAGPPTHYLVGVARLGLGGALLDRDRDAAALEEFEAAARRLARGLGAEHQDSPAGARRRGERCVASDRLDAAQGAAPTHARQRQRAFRRPSELGRLLGFGASGRRASGPAARPPWPCWTQTAAPLAAGAARRRTPGATRCAPLPARGGDATAPSSRCRPRDRPCPTDRRRWPALDAARAARALAADSRQRPIRLDPAPFAPLIRAAAATARVLRRRDLA